MSKAKYRKAEKMNKEDWIKEWSAPRFNEFGESVGSISFLVKQNKILLDAVEFYSNMNNIGTFKGYICEESPFGKMPIGSKAREALSDIKNLKEE